MRKIVKIVLTFVVLIIATPIFEIAKTNPILKLTLLAGIVAGITAIWKYNPNKDENNKNDNHNLDKT